MRKRIDDEVILQAALKCFAEYGYKKTTLDDIAAILDIKNSSIYAYTDSKRALYEDTVRFVMLRWQNRVKAAVAKAGAGREKFFVLCETALNYLAEDKEFCSLLSRDPSIFPMFPSSDPYEEINDESVRMIADILREGYEKGEFRELEAEAVSEVIFSVYKSFIIHAYVNGEDRYLTRYMQHAFDLILNGIAK